MFNIIINFVYNIYHFNYVYIYIYMYNKKCIDNYQIIYLICVILKNMLYLINIFKLNSVMCTDSYCI